MPTANDYDTCPYLPSARLIQSTFGGLVKLRTDLNIEGPVDFTTGAFRSAVAAKTFANARIYEEDFYNYLISYIPEIRVHEQKRLRPGNISCDFFIYTSDNGGFAIDLFYAESLSNANKVVNIKRKRYDLLTEIPIYFVLVNDAITQEELTSSSGSKKIPLCGHVKLHTEKHFKSILPNLISGTRI